MILLIIILTWLSICLAVLFFIGWAAKEHLQARKYRELTRLHEEVKRTGGLEVKRTVPHWSIQFKEGRQTRLIDSLATTEGEALLEVIKQCPNATILSVKRVP